MNIILPNIILQQFSKIMMSLATQWKPWMLYISWARILCIRSHFITITFNDNSIFDILNHASIFVLTLKILNNFYWQDIPILMHTTDILSNWLTFKRYNFLRDIFFSLAKHIALIERKKYLKIAEHVVEYILIMDGFFSFQIHIKPFWFKQ